MNFTEPLWLLALTALPLVWWVHRSGVGAVPARQRRAALWVRLAIVLALILSLAGTALALPDNRRVTVFVVDVSDSVGFGARAQAEDFIAEALATKPEDALAAVVVFGGDARVEMSLTEVPVVSSISSQPDPTASDIARALRLAAALMPEGARRRVVLFSDGRETRGDAALEAQALRDEGVVVDVIASGGIASDDVAITRVDAPSRVRANERFTIEAEVNATSAGPATLVLTRDGREIARRSVQLQPGREGFSFGAVARRPGSEVYTVRIETPGDAVSQNDTGSSLVLVSGPPRVLVVEGAPREGDELVSALRARELVVDRTSPADLGGGQDLAAYDGVILVDVPATVLTTTQTDTLGAFVRDLGGGLVSIAGESSWALGEYRDSPLEELLPLTSDIKDPRRRPSIAQMLAIDTSGSMAACHCNPEGGGSIEEAGVNKTDISRTAAAQAISALSEQDEVGVLAFNTRSNVVIPLQQLPPEEVVTQGLAKLNPAGGTAIPQAVRSAVRQLKESTASIKHIVLFTDGFTNQKVLPGLGAWVRKQGITLSVLATGEGTGRKLEKMAAAGGGRFYPGRDLYEIPEILMNEVMTAMRNYVNEGVFYPTIAAESPATAAVQAAPPILGFIGTAPKSSASVEMTIGKYDDPLLATWRTGLGIASAWTSDAKARWARRWVGWNGFADFWSGVVRQTLPAAAQPGFSTQAGVGDGAVSIRVESEAIVPAGAEAIARVVGPDGSTTEVPLGRDGLQAFEAAMPATGAGAYLVSAEISDGEEVLYREKVGAVSSYSAEYLPAAPDSELMETIASTTEGRAGMAPARAFDGAPSGGSRRIEIAGWLTLLAALLLPIDIALRRLVLTREDLQAARAWRPAPLRVAPQGPRSESLDRMLKVKQSVPRPRPAEPPAAPTSSPPAAPTEPTARAAPAVTKPPPELSETPPDGPGTAEGPGASGASELLRRKRQRKGK